MKKRLVILLITGLVFNFTFAQSEPAKIRLTPASQIAYINDPVSVQVEIEGVTGLFAASITLAFDNAITKCTGIIQGNFLVNNPGGYDTFFETFPADLQTTNYVIVDQSILGIATVSGTGTLFTITFNPVSIGTSHIEVTDFSLRDISNQVIPADVESAAITVSPAFVNTKVFLEGPFLSGSMVTTLNSEGFLPLTQPYSAAPWNYNGSESVANDFFTSHPDIVDWVLIELRTDLSANSTIASRAALLKDDGAVVDIDGVSPVPFFISSADYYVVIKHRNHLSIMSSVKVSLSENTPLYDFTTLLTLAYGTNAMADLGGGVFGLYCGDANANGEVQINDFEDIWFLQNGLSGYYQADFNLNAQVQINDYEDYWMRNNGRASQVPN